MASSSSSSSPKYGLTSAAEEMDQIYQLSHEFTVKMANYLAAQTSSDVEYDALSMTVQPFSENWFKAMKLITSMDLTFKVSVEMQKMGVYDRMNVMLTEKIDKKQINDYYILQAGIAEKTVRATL